MLMFFFKIFGHDRKNEKPIAMKAQLETGTDPSIPMCCGDLFRTLPLCVVLPSSFLEWCSFSSFVSLGGAISLTTLCVVLCFLSPHFLVVVVFGKNTSVKFDIIWLNRNCFNIMEFFLKKCYYVM